MAELAFGPRIVSTNESVSVTETERESKSSCSLGNITDAGQGGWGGSEKCVKLQSSGIM